jgi:hypothetical protein
MQSAADGAAVENYCNPGSAQNHLSPAVLQKIPAAPPIVIRNTIGGPAQAFFFAAQGIMSLLTVHFVQTGSCVL